jgi:Fe-S-cluster-containing hydrogenase component 2
MACAQICPTSALGGGSDQPQLNLIEDRCIQCGLCRRACPEKAIALDPRFVYERKISEKQQVLNREASFNCICCGKPFAAARLVERMEARLAGHWMYRSPEERRRLKMCRDCRLQDIFGSQPLEEIR